MTIVSIIIPVYNSGKDLKRCLDSVLNQTFKDIEIIVVNDGSTDESGEICKSFAKRDHRIKYIEQANGGVSTARNNGLMAASGEYVCFIDSDDYVDSDYVQCMVNSIDDSNADIAIQGLKQFKDGEIIKTEEFDSGTYSVYDLPHSLFDAIFYYCGPYCKLFKSAIIKENYIKFPADLSYGEDAVFYHRYLEKCNSILLLSQTTYNYMVGNQGALSNKLLNPDIFWKNQKNRRGAYLRLSNLYSLANPISDRERLCKMSGVTGMLSSLFKSHLDDKRIAKYLEDMSCDRDFDFNGIKGASLKQKIILRLIRINNSFSRKILKIFYK